MKMNRDEIIRKLLDSTAGSHLFPEQMSRVLSELVFKLNPILAKIRGTQIAGDSYKHNQRTAIPSVSTISGENATTVSASSTYNRVTTDLKIMKAKGGVTGFQKAASRAYIDSYKTELQGSLTKLSYDMENMVLNGDATADSYQFDGVENLLPTAGKVDNYGAVDLTLLDNMIDYMITKGGRGDDIGFFMSTAMVSAVTRKMTATLHAPVEKVMIEGGFRFETYRGIPLIETSFLAPLATMTDFTSVAAAAGGALPDGVYYYRVAAVTSEGETIANTSDTATCGAGNNTIDLTWPAYTDALNYKIFRSAVGGSAGDETLLDTIAARTYDADGNVTGSVTTYSDATASTADGVTKPLSEAVAGNPDESIMLLDFTKNKGLEMVYTNENANQVNNLVTFMELARTEDKMEYLLKSYLALILRNENLGIRARNVRKA